jgi:PPM family protein phosphatase
MSSQPLHSPPAAPLAVHASGDSHPGRVREINEDSFYCPGKPTHSYKKLDQSTLMGRGYLLIVADGIGGSDLGQRASREVVQSLRDVYYESPLAGSPDQRLANAVQYANDSLYQMRLRNPALGQAGSTVVAAAIQNNYLYLGNAGDSRAYLIRNGQAFKRTNDHTLIEEKKARGLPPAETDKGVITRSMGEKPTLPSDCFYSATPLLEGDAVLLCSDGLTDVVKEEDIAKVVTAYAPKQAVDKLIKMANNGGGPDNITVIVAKIGQAGKAVPAVAVDKRKVAIGMAIVIILLLLALIVAALATNSSGGNGAPSTPTAPATPTSVPTRESGSVTPGSPRPPTATPAPTQTPTHTPTPRILERPSETPTPEGTAAPTLETPVTTGTGTPTPVACPPGQFWDPIVGRCKNEQGSKGTSIAPTRGP